MPESEGEARRTAGEEKRPLCALVCPLVPVSLPLWYALCMYTNSMSHATQQGSFVSPQIDSVAASMILATMLGLLTRVRVGLSPHQQASQRAGGVF